MTGILLDEVTRDLLPIHLHTLAPSKGAAAGDQQETTRRESVSSNASSIGRSVGSSIGSMVSGITGGMLGLIVGTSSASNESMSGGESDREADGAQEVLDREAEAEAIRRKSSNVQLAKIRRMLGEPNMDMDKLRKTSWSGVPYRVRGTVWQLLLGYLPANKNRREDTLRKRRREYVLLCFLVFRFGSVLAFDCD